MDEAAWAPCAGVVAVRSDLCVAVVFTRAGWASLPKGKYTKSDGTTVVCALRELEEETGIRLDAGDLERDVVFCERSPKHRGPVINCYLALNVDHPGALAPRDGDDIRAACWVPLGELTRQRWRTPARETVIADIVTYVLGKARARGND
jgi:8-oxo-dGTP pyrophosphatase MutT (NUDIX family)